MMQRKKITSRTYFPPAWLWLVDEAIPNYVKQNYSPKESWKDKPFSPADASFFFKGIDDLSELFTDERPKSLPAYFNHPKYRSAYLLYFVPLQAAKFLALFDLHSAAIEAAFDHAKKTGVFRIADLGAGPGTASIAALLWLLNQKLETGEELPSVELIWFDTNRGIMEDGKALVELLGSHFPKLRNKIQVELHARPWWEASEVLRKETSLILIGHVLNEATAPRGKRSTAEAFEEDAEAKKIRESAVAPLEKLMKKMSGAGILLVEPAARVSSQQLSRIRDQLIESGSVPQERDSFWGPCPHAEGCPLAEGRDWCHFSVPVDIPGTWFKKFSKGLGSERHWLKYSYVWFTSDFRRSKPIAPHLRKVVSDPLKKPGATHGAVLLCEPERPARLELPPRVTLHRGDVIDPKAFEKRSFARSDSPIRPRSPRSR